MTKSAVIDVALTIETFATVTPLPLTATVAPATKFVPVSVSFTVVPVTTVVALKAVSVGAGGLTVKVAAALMPPDVETVTL